MWVSKVSKKFNLKSYLGNNLVGFAWTHLSEKRKNLSLNNHFFTTPKTILMSVNRKIKTKGNIEI